MSPSIFLLGHTSKPTIFAWKTDIRKPKPIFSGSFGPPDSLVSRNQTARYQNGLPESMQIKQAASKFMARGFSPKNHHLLFSQWPFPWSYAGEPAAPSSRTAESLQKRAWHPLLPEPLPLLLGALEPLSRRLDQRIGPKEPARRTAIAHEILAAFFSVPGNKLESFGSGKQCKCLQQE